MKPEIKLTDEFDNVHYNHFTHCDYLLKLIENGQDGEFINHLKLLSNESLIIFFPLAGQNRWSIPVKTEILVRMINNNKGN
jgi:hypothetical protein